MSRKDLLKGTKRIIIKIGTSSLTADDKISPKKIEILAEDICELREKGYEVILVSSGAISAGAGALNKPRKNLAIPEKQALAAVGQSILMDEYRHVFSKKGIEVGQILLTEDDIKSRERFLNLRNTFNALLDLNVLPIVNENDSVVVKEIKFGDNDTLSAHVANIVAGDLVIILSDIDGFYWDLADPAPMSEVTKVNADIKRRAGGSGSQHGTGGMYTKICAAEMLLRCGVKMIIANSKESNILSRLTSGEPLGTLFHSATRELQGRKRWIAFNNHPSGKIIIDEGAEKAICSNKKSLLASGVISTEGKFSYGDIVDVISIENRLLAKGVVNYNRVDLELIKGKQSREIKTILSERYFDEVINRDNLILTDILV